MPQKPTTPLTYDDLNAEERKDFRFIKIGEDVGPPPSDEEALQIVAELRSSGSHALTAVAAKLAWALIVDLRKAHPLTGSAEARLFGTITDGVRRAVRAGKSA